jgi:hypothetical protein
MEAQLDGTPRYGSILLSVLKAFNVKNSPSKSPDYKLIRARQQRKSSSERKFRLKRAF